MKRLGDVVRSPNTGSLDGALDRAILGEYDNGGLRKAVAYPLQKAEPAHLGNAQIRDDDFDGILFENVERLFGGGSGAGAKAGLANNIAAKIACCVLIVDNKNGGRCRPRELQRGLGSGCHVSPL